MLHHLICEPIKKISGLNFALGLLVLNNKIRKIHESWYCSLAFIHFDIGEMLVFVLVYGGS